MGITIIALIALFIINILFAFNGNPMRANIAERNIKKYANINLDLSKYDIGEIKYLFKPNKYYIHFQNRLVKDDNFNIYFSPETKQIDANEYYIDVLNKVKTINRLSKEYEDKITNILGNNLPDSVINYFKNIKINFSETKDYKLKDVPLDTKLEEMYKYPVHLGIFIEKNNMTDYNAACDFRYLKKLLIKSGVIIDYFSIRYNDTENNYVFNDIASDMIDMNNFDEILRDLRDEFKERERFLYE